MSVSRKDCAGPRHGACVVRPLCRSSAREVQPGSARSAAAAGRRRSIHARRGRSRTRRRAGTRCPPAHGNADRRMAGPAGRPLAGPAAPLLYPAKHENSRDIRRALRRAADEAQSRGSRRPDKDARHTRGVCTALSTTMQVAISAAARQQTTQHNLGLCSIARGVNSPPS